MGYVRRLALSARRIASALLFLYLLAAGRSFAPAPPTPISVVPAATVSVAFKPSLAAATPITPPERARAPKVARLLSRSMAALVPSVSATVETSEAAATSPDPEPLDSVTRATAWHPPSIPLAQSAVFEPRVGGSPKSRVLLPLYVTFGSLQALDYHSTRRALSSGAGREANPIARAIVTRRPALIASKTLATALVITAGERMRKRHPVGAVIFVAGLNAAMAAVVAHNYSVK